MCPCKERLFCCTLSFVGSTVFECEQTGRNLSYHGNTPKCAECCSKSKKVQKITLKTTYWAARQRAKPSAMQQDFCQHPRDVADMWLDIVVDVDLVTLASLSRVKKSGRIQY